MTKETLIDWYDNAYYFLRKGLKLKVQKFYAGLKRWFSYFKVSQDIFDFDYTSILLVEKHQIKRVRDSIAYFHNHIDADIDIEKMNLALNLLNIVLEDGCAKYIGPPIDFSQHIIEIKGTYYMPIYVNTRNANRFIKNINITDDIHKDRLRVKKAWYLYNKLREQYLMRWWD